ncbi:MAG: flavodoxin family protein [Promethearchaeota archaeon]
MKKQLKAVIIYWSKTGNTEKVALTIKDCLKEESVNVILKRTENAEKIDFYDYDLLCFGCPSYGFHPPEPVEAFLKNKMRNYRKDHRVKLGAPKIPGKNVLIFCTFSGPHTGINEAIPVGKITGQYFEHLGFSILDELYIVGEFHGNEKMSTMGRMGDIKGRPNEEDLKKVKKCVQNLLKKIR